MMSVDRADVLKALESEGFAKVGSVHLEVHEAAGAGWAVFAGCDGEDPDMVALYVGRCAREMAAALLAAKVDDGGEMVSAVFDACLVPAYVDDKGAVVVANHMPPEEGIAVLAELFDVPAERWG